MYAEEAKNFRLLGHDRTAAWGGGSRVEVKNGFAYVGAVGGSSYTGPEGFTVHDVRDPRNPHKVAEVLGPPGTHMHKLGIVGDDILYVNAERLRTEAGKTARSGFFIYDIKDPANLRQVGFYDMPGYGPHRFRIDNERQLAHFPSDADGWKRRVVWTMDVRNPLKPDVVSIWGMPQQKGDFIEVGKDPEPPDAVFSVHGPPVIRGNRMYVAFLRGGIAIVDCTDLRDMKLIGHLCWSPPFPGITHTVWPIGDRPYLVVADEASMHHKYWDSQFMWVLDIRNEAQPLPVATYFPDREKYFHRPGRFGAHNIIEYIPAKGPWANLVFITFYNAGLRAVDVSDPLIPKEVGCYVPAVPEGQQTIQSSDVGYDEHGRIYLIDRAGAGMHILEYTG